jgi:hypothetical protein
MNDAANRPPDPKGLPKVSDAPVLARWLPPLVAILVLYLGLALGYSLTVPVFEAPDEQEHLIYASELAAGAGLPVLDYGNPSGEYHQPPLYYGLVAGVLRWFDTSAYEQFTVRNPHAAISDVSTFGNKNAFLHDPEREGWPFKGLSLAVHLARLVSIGLGMVTVGATYGLALKLFSPPAGRNASVPWMAAAAAAVVAFNPQFLFISGALNNDNAVTALCSLALWATVTYYDRSRSVRWLVALGGLSGLAILTKATGVAVTALILGVLAAKAIRQRQVRTLWLDAGIVILLTVLVGGWWYARNALLYADPFLARYINRYQGDRDAPKAAMAILRSFVEGEISFWGTFGWLNITWSEWVYTLLRGLTHLSGLGLVVLGVRGLITKRTHISISALVITLAWVGLVAVALTKWILVAGGLQGRLLFPAISALAALLITGWTSLVPRRWELRVAAIPVAGLALLAVATPFVTLAPAYARPTPLPSTTLPPDAIPVDLTYAGRVKLIGYHLSPPAVHAGDRVDVTLYWQAIEPPPGNFSVYVHLFGRNRQRIGAIDTYPGLGNLPTSQWRAGQVIRDVYPIRIAPDAAAPTLVTISVGWYNFYGARESVPALDPFGQPTTTAGVFKLIPRVWPEPKLAHRADTNFDDAITLLGYDVQPQALAEGAEVRLSAGPGGPQAINLTLYWRCNTPTVDNLTLLVHLIDEDGHTVAQMDQPPVNGDYPTRAWSAGEIVEDTHRLSLPSDLSPGDYRLVVGLYQRDTLRRLSAFDAQGQRLRDDVVPLLTLSVEKQSR